MAIYVIFLLNQVLHLKLSSKSGVQCAGIKSLVLYDGSITDFDSRLYGFDIGTCLEVLSPHPSKPTTTTPTPLQPLPFYL